MRDGSGQARGAGGEALIACVVAALPLGALGGATVGLLEAAQLLAHGVARYPGQGLRLALLAGAGYGVLGLLLACLCAACAWALWRPPGHRAAPASACAGLGTMLGVLAFVWTRQIGTSLLVPAALAATLACLVLRELLGWLPRIARIGTWAALCAVAGVLALALAFVRAEGGTEPGEARVARPNLLLVTLDTLRADHLGCYGAADAHTLSLDALAQESALFEDTTSQANTTGPSHVTMLTGLYPLDHGALQNGMRIGHAVPTLPEVLAREGYATAAFVGGYTLKDQACGLAARFARYDDELIAWRWMPEVCARLRLVRAAIDIAGRSGKRILRADRPAVEVVDGALAWLARQSDERPPRPWFLWVHMYDAHAPYEPPPPFDRLHDPDWQGETRVDWYKMSTHARRALVDDPRGLEHGKAMYKGEIAYVDAQVGRLFEALKQSGAWSKTLVAVTSDHGEGLGEHGYYFDHGTYLYDTELRVPLLLRLPTGQGGAVIGAGRRIPGQTRLLDLAPTLLEALEISMPWQPSGASLLPLMEGSESTDPPASVAVGEFAGEHSGYPLDGRKRSIRVRGHKLVWTSEHWLDTLRVPEQLEYFDLEADPLEQKNVYDPEAAPKSMQREMERQLEEWRKLPAAGGQEMDPETRDALRRLGYTM